MGIILDRVKGFLEADGWSYEEDEERGALFSAVSFDDTDFAVIFGIRDEVQLILFYVINPEPVPVEGRLAVAEFMSRANYQINIGNFEMDFEDGEVRYRTSVDVEGVEWGEQLFQNLVGTGVRTMQGYHEALQAVASGSMSAADAHQALVEGMAAAVE